MKNDNFVKTHFTRQQGYSMVELILVIIIFAFSAVAAISLIMQGLRATRLSAEQTVATQFAAEGLEAVRAIKNQNYYTLLRGTTGPGVTKTGNSWAFSASANTLGKYTRTVNVLDARWDYNGNIVASTGVVNLGTKKVTSRVNWQFGPGRNESIVLTSYFSNWKGLTGGMLVYGNGGTTSDAMVYKTLDPLLGTWSSALSLADVDGTSTNRYVRALRVYSAKARNEKVVISRHYNGTTQYIYGQVFNGTTQTWGNVQLLASWNAATFLDVRNFDGTYLSNGSFMVVYSDNTSTPKFRVWNGTNWSAASISTRALSGVPTYINVQARPGTSEVMLSTSDQANDTDSMYFNGRAYIAGNWSATEAHSTNSPVNTKKLIDFVWSPNNPLLGFVTFTNSTTDKTMRIKKFTANGTGGGAWGGVVTATAQVNNIGSITINALKNGDELMLCNKDAGATPTIRCYKSTYIPAFSNPTNQAIAAATDTGIQISYDLSYEGNSTNPGIVMYSDNTAVPKYKLYDKYTATFDAAATSLTTTPYTLGVVKTVRAVPLDIADDILFLIADANLDLYTVIWNGSANAMYTTPSGKAFSQHGTNGSATTDLWYDFVWDAY